MQKGGEGQAWRGIWGGGEESLLRGEKSCNSIWNLTVCVGFWGYKDRDALSFKEGMADARPFISGSCPRPWHRRFTRCCHGQCHIHGAVLHICRAVQARALTQPLELYCTYFYSCFYTKARLLEVLLAPSTGHGWGLGFSPLITTLRN